MEEAPAELAQANALQLPARQQHRGNRPCYTEAGLAQNLLDQIHLMMQVNKLALSAAVFFQKSQQEKVILHLHCVPLCTLPVEHSLFPLSPSCWQQL